MNAPPRIPSLFSSSRWARAAALAALIVAAGPRRAAAEDPGVNAPPSPSADNLAAAVVVAPVAKPSGGVPLRLLWKDGIVLESEDGETFSGKIGGRIQLDSAVIKHDDGTPDSPSGFEARRLRLATSGEVGGPIRILYKLQIDFAGAKVKLADAFVGLKKLPYLGTLQFGQQKEPFSLEELTSDDYITFLERSLPNAFGPDRQIGVRIANHGLGERATYSLGLFTRTADGSSAPFKSNADVALRVTGVLWDGGKTRLLHLGVGGLLSDPRDDLVVLVSRPESRVAPEFVGTGMVSGARRGLTGNVELAFVHGPLSLQAQAIANQVTVRRQDNPTFHGMYVMASYFLTGESRPYDRAEGIFTRVKPNHAFGAGGCGAVELAARLSALDLDSGAITGGRLLNGTFGLNWYLNPSARLMFNYVYASLERGAVDGTAHIAQVRLQADF